METTSLIAMSRQSGLQRQMDIVANNIANMNTNGFKGENMMFVEHLVKSQGGQKLLGSKLSFVRDIATMTDFSDGPSERTGNPLDLAIRAEGYFVIQTDKGERYTRNGRFKLDEGGQMVTQKGDPVLSSGNNPIFLSPEDTEISISRDGTVSTNNGDLGRLKLVTFEKPQLLKRSAGGIFAPAEGQRPKDVESPDIAQGMLEGSNVKPILEMAKMIDVQRTYDGVRDFIDREDERMRNMVKEMGQTV
ncbi:MAG: flagellar basal-body rod protein FlgF [Rhodospirillales bacterium]|nr:flagellar basal-body rod protein FlgF [Rhodospirillales bacterium]